MANGILGLCNKYGFSSNSAGDGKSTTQFNTFAAIFGY